MLVTNSSQAANLKIKCIRESDKDLLKHTQYVMIGISPFNSYYTEQRIYELIRWASKNFEDFLVFAADGISVYNFLSRGYTQEEAERKTRLQDNLIRNRIFRVFEALHISKSHLVTWVSKKDDLLYQELVKKYKNEVDNNPLLERLILDTVNNIGIRSKNNIISQEKIGINYAIYEFPFLLNLPTLFGMQNIALAYHDASPLMSYIYEKCHLKDQTQTFLCLKIEE